LYDYVKESLALSFPSDIIPENRIVMIFTVYLDESGIHRDSQDVVIAGYIATNEQWISFETEWKQALSEFGIPFFHMSDYAARKSHYKTWKNSERETRYERLTNIIKANTTYSVGITISRIDYAAAMGAIAPTMASGLYGYIVNTLVLSVYLALRSIGYPDAQIAYVLDRHKGSGAIFSLLTELGVALDNAAHENGKDSNLVGFLSVTAEDSKRFVPLQAADILAYQLYRAGSNYHRVPNVPRASKHFDMLKTKNRFWMRFDEAEIRHSMSKSMDIRMNLLRLMSQ